ncbi:MAG: ACP S-malonyltransferase [Clostridiales Family XIII bacterium]|jgi:[acyl-carrier-protein] S-malonyltransferase|nr:ACP S-malonyltransferase [Clostridiales Family XIII bacterium]
MTKAIKIAVVFAGQGAQYPGMGKSLYDASAAARTVFDEAGAEIRDKCFFASADELKETSTTQPAVYTVDMAAWAALTERLNLSSATFGNLQTGVLRIGGVAGFSLGEYAALTAAGVIPDVRTGYALVCARGMLMTASGRYPDGSPRGMMAAVLGSVSDILKLVESAREEDVLEAVNFNSASQTVIAGDTRAIARFGEKAKIAGVKVKVIPLAVSTAFHSPIMNEASDGLAEIAKEFTFGSALYPVYLNLSGETLDTYGTGAEEYQEKIRAILTAQVKSPVYWQKTVENLVKAGAAAIIEIGPGKTLTGLTKKTVPNMLALHVEDEETLNETIAALDDLCGNREE